jgi:hypothetical protein
LDEKMTTVANLLARKQQLLERLQENPGPNEREEIDRLLEQIDTALDLLEEAGANRSRPLRLKPPRDLIEAPAPEPIRVTQS